MEKVEFDLTVSHSLVSFLVRLQNGIHVRLVSPSSRFEPLQHVSVQT